MEQVSNPVGPLRVEAVPERQAPQVPPGPPAGIVVDGVARSFGGVHAVRGMSFRARQGAVTALIGPNGAGKTTLMLMLASLLAPDAGQIRIAGIDPVAEPRRVRRALGWMPDVLGTWRTLSPSVALTTVGRMHGMPTPMARQRSHELIRQLRLEELADRPSRVLSRGQQQRLGLARAIVHWPSVLLLDEPAAGLDPASRVALRQLLRSLADQGCTILVSSHDLAELDEMADDAVFVDRGEVVADDRLHRARTAAREWRIRSLDPGRLSVALARIGVALGRVRDEAPVTLVALDSDADAASLLARLVEERVPIVHFAPAVGDIERTYLGLAGGGA